MKNNSEVRSEYSYWQKSKHIFLEGIDKNKTLPDHAKAELKELIAQHFRVIGQLIGTVEIIYLREKQNSY